MSVMVRSICGSSSTIRTGSRGVSACKDVIQNREEFLGWERFLQTGVNQALRVGFAVAIRARARSAEDQRDARTDSFDGHDGLVVGDSIHTQIEHDRRRSLFLQRVQGFVETSCLERFVPVLLEAL